MKIKHLLFSYGTLQLKNVQLENYGRILTGVKDKLKGYKLDTLKIENADVFIKSGLERHPIAIKSACNKDTIVGIIFELTEDELLQTDRYEVSEYIRILETFESGNKAWLYVAKNNNT